jgi:hypothetical protein
MKRFKAAKNFLTLDQIDILRETFEDGSAAESLDFILDQYVSLEDLYTKLENLSQIPEFWGDVLSIHFLAIKLLYNMIRAYPVLNVNEDVDTSVTYWTNQVEDILSKILADKTPRS